MRIYLENLENRFATSVDLEEWNDRVAGEDYLLVVHPEDANRSVERSLPGWLKDERCKSVLYVKGVPFGGLGNRVAAEKVESLYPGRVHFLSFVIERATDLSAQQKERFEVFFKNVRDRDFIDWNVIDPLVPESLVALYLLATAAAATNDQSRDAAVRIMSQYGQWQQIEEAGLKEVRTFIRPDFPHSRLTLENASEVASIISGFFKFK